MRRPRASSLRVVLPICLLVSAAIIANPLTARAAADYDAEILEERYDIEIRSINDARVRYSKRTKILTRSGVEEFGSAVVPYYPGVTIRSFKGSVTMPSGKRVKVDKGRIVDAALLASFQLYSDSRMRAFDFPGAVPGSIVEHSYELDIENLRFLPSRIEFRATEPIRLKTVTLTVPVAFPIRISVRGDPPDHSSHEKGGKVTHTWTVSDVPAITINPNSPPKADLVPYIAIEAKRILWGDYELDTSSWEGIARFYWELARDRMEPTSEVSRKAADLTAGIHDAAEKTRLIYEFVQGNVNYVAIALDIGGWQPHHSADVLAHLYGDCKDKATLMIAMLRSVDLQGFPVLIRTRQTGMLDRDRPALDFNHAIVAVPSGDGYLFLDPTSEHTPYGDLPWIDQGVWVVVVGEEGKGELLETPLLPAGHNRRHLSISGAIDDSGEVEGTLVIEAWGQRRSELMPLLGIRSKEREDYLEWLTSKLAPGARMTAQEIRPPSGPDDPLRITAIFSVPGYMTRVGRVEIVSPHLSRLRDLATLAAYSSRSQPLFFEYPFTDTIESRLSLPPGRTVRKLPEALAYEGSGLQASTEYDLAREGDRNVLVVRRSVTISRREIPVEEYPALRDFISRLVEEEAKAVTLQRGN